MHVKKVSITNHSDYNPEELIVHIARVSNPSNQDNMETAPRLIKYLIKHKHWSPFEMVDLTYEIKTSRAIGAQILRHRSFSFQEFSQRYSKNTKMENLDLRFQAEKNRQSSKESIKEESEFYDDVERLFGDSIELYKRMIQHGIAKETARLILPLNTQTTIYMKGSVRSWLSYLNVRLEENTQLEHRLIAKEIAMDLKDLFPNIYEATNNLGNMNGNFM